MGFTVNNEKDQCLINRDEYLINSAIQIIIDEQDGISNVLSQPLSNHMTSVTDSELEHELANLVYEHSEDDYTEKTFATITSKSTEV